MKGRKIYIAQYRKKQMLKKCVINNHNFVKLYLNNFYYDSKT
jgi:hypothetical protein